MASEDRERVETAIRAKSCKWGVYISQRKQTGDTWIQGWTNNHHSHHPNPNAFSYDQHTAKKPRYTEALARASVYSGAALYATFSKMLRKEGLLTITRKKYYSINRKLEGEGGRLTKQVEIQVLLKYLEDHNFHVQVRYEHLLDGEGRRTSSRVV
jgi:hypothetical protein